MANHSTIDVGGMAQRQYYSRPADEGFGTLAEGITAAERVKAESRERVYSARDLSVRESDDHGLVLHGPRGDARFNHHSFGTLARAVGAPAGYLRELPPALAAADLSWGLAERIGNGVDLNLLVRQSPGDDLPLLRAVASTTYGRVWDADLMTGIRDTFRHDSAWTVPPTWPGGRVGGVYLGEPDSFLLLVNGGSIVNDPTVQGGDGAMYRGIMARNSEVGECSVTLAGFWFRYICGNHMIGGLEVKSQYRRRHVGARALRDTLREVAQLARTFTQSSASQDENLIRLLAEREIATTREGVIGELVKLGVPAKTAAAAYDTCEAREPASPRSYWGVAQGMTRYSQAVSDGHQNERLELDTFAAQILQRGRKLVAA